MQVLTSKVILSSDFNVNPYAIQSFFDASIILALFCPKEFILTHYAIVISFFGMNLDELLRFIKSSIPSNSKDLLIFPGTKEGPL